MAGRGRPGVLGLVLLVLPMTCGERDRTVSGAFEPPPCEPVSLEDCCAAYCNGDAPEECTAALGVDDATAGCVPPQTALDCDGDSEENTTDCAPCDETRYHDRGDLARDLDGDGFSPVDGDIPWDATLCSGDEPPEGYVVSGSGYDCDDSDAERWRRVKVDQDGDGAMVWLCVGEEDPPGRVPDETVAVVEDCDDTDPSRQRHVYQDEDGDGYVAQQDHPTDCVAEDSVLADGLGYTPGADCDDTDPTIFPDQVDLLYDGVDTDCEQDGEESTGCPDPELEDGCACWGIDPCPVATTCADAADPAIAYTWFQFVCAQPGPRSRAVVANQGGAPFEGTVVVRNHGVYSFSGEAPYEGDCLVPTTFTLTLGPGETRVLELAWECVHVELEVVAGEDCDPANNSGEIPVYHQHCS